MCSGGDGIARYHRQRSSLHPHQGNFKQFREAYRHGKLKFQVKMFDFFFCVLEGFGGLCCCDVNWCGGRFGCVSA